MKRFIFTVEVEGLPDHAKEYRIAGAICSAATVELRQVRQNYGDQVNVLVAPASHLVRVQVESDAAFRKEARAA